MIAATHAPTFRQIALALIDEPVLPSRTEMDDTRMDELVASIRALGFISVLVVVALGDRFRVVAGHRRSIAARRAGLVSVPCFVYADASAALEAIQHAENRHREELSVTDEAIWFSQLHEAHPDEGTDGVAARVGETRAYVEGRLALLRGCDHVFAALAAKEIPIGVAQELNRCTEDAHRRTLLDMAVRGGATVGLVKQWVQEWKTIHAPAAPAAAPAAPVSTGGPAIVDDYFTCRVCGRRDNVANMRPVNTHDYCLMQLIDARTGLFKREGEYVLFPRTREDAEALMLRVLERFPELAA